MLSKRAVILSAVATASAQLSSTVIIPTYTSAMPTLSQSYDLSSSSSSDPYNLPGSYSSYTTTTTTTTTSIPYTNEFTIYLTQTNSMGVVTGMPSVVTSQPLPVTSQASAATLPAGMTPTTTAAPTTLATSLASSASQQQSSTSTSSNPVASHTGAASGLKVSAYTLSIVAGIAFYLF